MELRDVDLLDPDAFRLGRHHEMFQVLRPQDPVHWTDEPAAAAASGASPATQT